MAFISTLDSLQQILTSNIDLSNYATKTDLNSKANTSDLATIATSGSYNDLNNKPTLFSGDYADLDNKPTLFSGSYNDLTNKPTLFSGNYTDLTNKPTIPDTSDFVTNTTLTTKLAKSLEKGITVTASNNTFTINPNSGALFIVNVSANSTIAISNLDSDFSTNTGSVFSILLTLNASSYAVSWPNNISWHGGSAPELSYKNLITFTKFNSSSNWVGGSVVIDDTFPS